MIGKEAAVTHISQDGGVFDHFCGLDNAHVLSVFTHNYRDVFFFLSQLHPGQSTEWPGLMPVFCERVHV